MVLLASAASGQEPRRADAPGAGDAADGGPAEVAGDYLRAVEARAWERASGLLHADALGEVRRSLRIMLEADDEGRLADALTAGSGGREPSDLEDPALYVAAMEALERESPGIVLAMSDRDTEVLGEVAEGDSMAHAVYRSQWRLRGSDPEIEVLTLARSDGEAWRVRDAPELRSLRPALRGILLSGPGTPSTPPDPDTVR